MSARGDQEHDDEDSTRLGLMVLGLMVLGLVVVVAVVLCVLVVAAF